jgi:hypothetical protein
MKEYMNKHGIDSEKSKYELTQLLDTGNEYKPFLKSQEWQMTIFQFNFTKKN